MGKGRGPQAMSDLLQAVCQEKEYWEQLSIEKCFPSRSMIDAWPIILQIHSAPEGEPREHHDAKVLA